MKPGPISLILSLIAYIFTASCAYAIDDPYSGYQTKSARELLQLGVNFEHGEGVERNIDEAIRLYCNAARKGHPEAGYKLGWIYANGRGVTRNEIIAAAWFRLAAEAGDDYAERMLETLGQAADDSQRKCLLLDGQEYLPPLKSVPDPDRDQIHYWVKRLAPDYNLAAALVLAVIETESNFNVRARSHKNALGLMQLLPATAQRFGVNDILDPLDNLRGGMAYLSWLLDYFDGDLHLALAGYNAGEHAVDRFRGIPPYAETRAYVRQVLRLYRQSQSSA